MGKKINWGIIGPGNIAEKFAIGLTYIEDAVLHTVASRDSGRAKLFAEKYKIPNYYGKYEDIVGCEGLDIVYVATPHSSHYENTLLCLEKGIAVLCEKPVGINATEVRRMIEISRHKKVFLMEGMWTGFLPSVEKTLQIIREGQIGEIKHIYADFGFRGDFDPKNRLFNPELAGGSLLDIGIYPIFLCILLLGKPHRVSSACAIGFTGVDESCTISCSYHNGATASLFSSICVTTSTTAVIYGSKGKITLNYPWYAPTTLELAVEGKTPEIIQPSYIGNGFNYEAAEAMKCLLAGKIECEKMSHNMSYEIAQLMDLVRRQCRISYPKEQLVITM